jgi:hypothetical protein
MIWLPMSSATHTLLTFTFLFALTATSATSAKYPLWLHTLSQVQLRLNHSDSRQAYRLSARTLLNNAR